jgi:hypothetical protein
MMRRSPISGGDKEETTFNTSTYQQSCCQTSGEKSFEASSPQEQG